METTNDVDLTLVKNLHAALLSCGTPFCIFTDGEEHRFFQADWARGIIVKSTVKEIMHKDYMQHVKILHTYHTDEAYQVLKSYDKFRIKQPCEEVNHER